MRDPACLDDDPRAWLEARLGALAGFEGAQPTEETVPPELAAAAAPTMSFLPSRPVRASNPAAKAAALASTLGCWLDLMRHATPVDTHFRAPFSPAPPLHL
ncbi:hypothetical protein [Methylobacterium longum]|uniref:Uncharacterized protein n=1 Tax=Methylobacterium longum TaxID=767694 RepID=A0ABT8AQK5_9HYPH|nr:hypothetical protein [Methylobacterium longum]MDN3572183.1 hypothetical protein [Methylobacterium longum]GJE14601.1 hypothetical protein FOHLNKBM_5676 [Methylobacterium longum]